jgi:hypothetical protein
VWIEHGHQYDPINAFFVQQIEEWGGMGGPKPFWSRASSPVFEGVDGQQRLFECIGTRFLIKFLNGLDADYPFVDNVKPFSRFLKIFGASVGALGYGLGKPAVAVWSMIRFLGNRLISSPEDLLCYRKQTASDAQALVQSMLRPMSQARQEALADQLVAQGYHLEVPLAKLARDAEGAESLLAFLEDHLDLAAGLAADNEGLLGHGTAGTLSLAKGFNINETELLRAAARSILESGDAEIVVMGHTHERVDDPAYFNPGCWTRYYTFAPDDPTPAWQVLREDSYRFFPFQMNYVEIVPARVPLVLIETFREKRS